MATENANPQVAVAADGGNTAKPPPLQKEKEYVNLSQESNHIILPSSPWR